MSIFSSKRNHQDPVLAGTPGAAGTPDVTETPGTPGAPGTLGATRGLPRVSGLRAVELGAAAVALFLVLAACFPTLLAPFDPLAINPADSFQGPSAKHWFGTDESGRDIYSRVIHGARPSLLIGAAATAIGLGLALVLGTLAGLGGRWLDFGVGRILEVLFALPGLLLALVFIALAGPGITTSVVAVGLSTAPGYARIIRGQISKVRSSAMVAAAVVLGRRPAQVLFRHILPNALSPVFVLGTLGLGQAVVWASSLSFLGLGAPPPAAEWGAMLAAGRTYLGTAWWMTFFPGVAIVLTAASSTVLGRALQRRVAGR
ncbi:peptide/nickel transport system permease protein [Arthrobacter crystallopoietes]|uniref:Peptide/nickel transport system permease protein n=1 Tax=Crystallibacter crystallopoietes TaxID=37928 RepID=A0A1H1A715_9MICC|nr:peptide/nickel transport system permease protein [Arthrobacter crystallopoietes]